MYNMNVVNPAYVTGSNHVRCWGVIQNAVGWRGWSPENINHFWAYVRKQKMSCPKIGLHNSVKIWKDIQRNIHQNGNQNIRKNLRDLYVMII